MLVMQLAIAKDPEAAFFKRLEGLQPCEVSELKAGTHIFAVYGINLSFIHSLNLLSKLVFAVIFCGHLGRLFR